MLLFKTTLSVVLGRFYPKYPTFSHVFHCLRAVPGFVEMASNAVKKIKVEVQHSYHACTPQLLCELLVNLLDKLTMLNATLASTTLTRFHSRSPPAISLKTYIERLLKYCIGTQQCLMQVEQSVLIVILVYLDRMCAKNPTFAFNQLTSHRFIITSVTVGCKTVSDLYATNPFFAKGNEYLLR